MRGLAATVAKWKAKLSAAGKDYKDGIERVKESPMEKAAEAANTYLARVTEAVNSGKFQAALRAVTLDDWKKTADIGAQKLVLGAQKGERKFERFMRDFLPFLEVIRQEISTMPKGTYEERMARQRAYADGVHAYRRG